MVVEGRERQQGANVDERGAVEEQIDDVGEDRVFRLLVKVAADIISSGNLDVKTVQVISGDGKIMQPRPRPEE